MRIDGGDEYEKLVKVRGMLALILKEAELSSTFRSLASQTLEFTVPSQEASEAFWLGLDKNKQVTEDE